MNHDLHGLPLGTDSAGDAFNQALLSYLKYRADAGILLGQAIEADPDFALAHALRALFLLTAFKRDFHPVASQSAARAAQLAVRASAREQAHVAALQAWLDDDQDKALAIWEDILRQHPRDILAFRMPHFLNFWLGRPQAMLASIERIRPHWDESLPGFGGLLSCHSFALEECGHFEAAETVARAALAIDPADPWGAHALAHTLEMTGRQEEGIALLGSLEPHWSGASNIVHHLWWHQALFHLERREFDAVLALYDRRFRQLDAPLTRAQPDLYIDIQNAAAMLFRLGLHGMAVGDRWNELADKAAARIGDADNLLTLPHWMMALAATGRDADARAFMQALQDHVAAGKVHAASIREVALPVCQAVWAHGRGEHRQVVDLMVPVLSQLQRIGGSHAQRDVFLQMAHQAARRCDDGAAAAQVLAAASLLWHRPAAQRTGYR